MFPCLGCLFSEEKGDINDEIKLEFTLIRTFLGKLAVFYVFFSCLMNPQLDRFTRMCKAFAYVCHSPGLFSKTRLCRTHSEASLKIKPESTSSFDFSLHQQPHLTVP